ncbi:hypothetical protein DRO58_02525 [Candidatus Bathyarchaeota archaeon]|nr:MAG: hypothetical protein DRO58_02525 [Candidatus Bathyarchaeota archaeon]
MTLEIIKERKDQIFVKKIHLKMENLTHYEIKELLNHILKLYEQNPNYHTSWIQFNNISLALEE